MADFTAADPFGYRSTVTDYTDNVRNMDAAFRYAAKGTDPDKFREIVKKAFDPAANIMTEDTMCLMMMLLKSGKKEFFEIFRKAVTERENAYQPMRGFSDHIEMATLIKAMDFITDDLVETQFVPVNSFIPMGCMMTFMNNPLYHALITGNTDHANRYLDIMLEKDENLIEFILSAICFRDTDFLKTAFSKGVTLENEMVSAICTDTETVAYLCDNFSEYIFHGMTENDDPRNNMKDFIRLTVCDEAMFTFAENLYDRLGLEGFRLISDDIPKVKIIKAHYAENNIFNQYTSYDLDFLKMVLSDNIRVIIEDDHADFVFTLGDILKSAGINARITYDFLRCNTNFFSWQNLTTVKKFLKGNNINFNMSGFSKPLASLLDFNNETIVKEIISMIVINESNISEVIEYLTEKSLYRGLNAVNKFYTPVVI